MRAMLGVLILAASACASTTGSRSGIAPAPFANAVLSNPEQERAAQLVLRSVTCSACEGLSVAEHRGDLAADIRAITRQRISAGERPEAVRASILDRYSGWLRPMDAMQQAAAR